MKSKKQQVTKEKLNLEKWRVVKLNKLNVITGGQASTAKTCTQSLQQY